MSNIYMGIDAGTTGCKVAVYDADGNRLAVAVEKYQPAYPQPGWIELDAEAVLAAIQKAMAIVLKQVSQHTLAAISVSSQGEAVIPVDDNYQALAQAIVTFDNRTTPYVDFWENRLGRDRIYEITGVPLHGIFSINKILWFRDHRPDVFQRTHKFLCFDAFILARLGAKPSTDPSMAGKTMMMHLTERKWSKEILDVAGLHVDLLPEINEAGTIVGKTNQGVHLVQGGHDQVAGALGCGIVRPGQAAWSIGTTTCLTPCYTECRCSKLLMDNNLLTYPYLLANTYATNAFNFTGGILFDWCLNEFFRYETETRAARGEEKYRFIFDHLPSEPSSLFVLPYFAISGTPHLETQPMGAILNMSLATTKWDILKAALEAIVYEINLNVDILDAVQSPITELRVIGGATHSPIWMQLCADILGRDIFTVESTDDTACRGVVLLCVAALETKDVRSLAAAWTKTARQYTPNPVRHAIYSEKIGKYKTIYPTLKGIRHG